MGLFKKRTDIKNPEKVTYSEDDLKNLDLTYVREFSCNRGDRIHSALKKEIPRPLLTQIRDHAFSVILDRKIYSFKRLLVVPNPYGISVQTAMLIFNTEGKYAVHYHIEGKTPETGVDFTTEPTDRHLVPVMGLYYGKTNKLTVELIDEQGNVFKRRPLTIYVRDIPLNAMHLAKLRTEGDTEFPVMLYNGVRFMPAALDQNLDVRYVMEMKTNKAGLIPLDNGHFLIADGKYFTSGGYTCCYYECDYIGRIYRTVYIDRPMGMTFASRKDSLFFTTSSENDGIYDAVAVCDLKTGTVTRQISVKDITGNVFEDKNFYGISCISLGEKSLLVTVRYAGLIISMDPETFEVTGIIGDLPEGSPYTGNVLRYENLPEKITAPDSAAFAGSRGKIAVYSVQFNKITKEETFPGGVETDNKTSLVTILDIDPDKKTASAEYTSHTLRFFRNSSVLLSKSGKRMLVMAGTIPEKEDGTRANVSEFDITENKIVRRYTLYRPFVNAWEFSPDLKSYCTGIKPEKNVIFGDISGLDEIHEDPGKPVDEKLKKRIAGDFRLCAGMLLFSMLNRTSAVTLKGKKTGRIFTQRYDDIIKDPRFAAKRHSFCLDLNGLPADEYDVFITDNEEKVYRLKDDIRITGGKEKKKEIKEKDGNRAGNPDKRKRKKPE